MFEKGIKTQTFAPIPLCFLTFELTRFGLSFSIKNYTPDNDKNSTSLTAFYYVPS